MAGPESFEQFIKSQKDSNIQKDILQQIQAPQFQQTQDIGLQHSNIQYPQKQSRSNQQQGMMPMQDPFMMDQYRNVNIPNTPISYGGGMADSLLNNSEIPEDIQLKYWAFIHKDNVLSFQDDITKQEKLINMDIVKCDILTTVPYYDYDFKQELEFNIMRHVLDTKLDRAKGFSNGGKPMNERIILQSQFSENRNINENNDSDIKQGFFKRLLSRKG